MTRLLGSQFSSQSKASEHAACLFEVTFEQDIAMFLDFAGTHGPLVSCIPYGGVSIIKLHFLHHVRSGHPTAIPCGNSPYEASISDNYVLANDSR